MRGKNIRLLLSCTAFLFFCMLACVVGVAPAKTIYVPDDYAKIQWAVDNASEGDTIIVRPGTYIENIDADKSVDIRSYSQNPADTIIIANNPDDHVFYVSANNVNITGFTVTGAGIWKAGVYLDNSDYSKIENVNASNNWNGIYLSSSNNNTLANNTASSNNWLGIYLSFSNNNTIANNNASNNYFGIYLYHSNNNTITNNTASSNNYHGIFLLYESNKNILAKNTASSNSYDGISLWYSNKNILANNNALNNENGIHLWHSNNNTLIKNTASNNEDGIHLYESNNNTIANNNASNNEDGIYLKYSNNNTIANNTALKNYDGISLVYSNNNTLINNNASSNNRYGIWLKCSNNSTLAKNTVSNNNYCGIYLYYSNNNIIYLNNFINNTYHVSSSSSTNIWNSTEKITYTYKGKTYENYLGNYWDDYNGSDANGDGIGDTPYSIDSDKDDYPLIERFKNYFMPTPAKIFDTGRPENPYPSISGKFIGTIKTNTKIIATKLYTYACEGTGGHTEHALICNSTWCAYAEWDGYKGDWMNISFNKTVILMPHETYNITIVTGSYPQIHHTPSLKTENEWINCTEFIDVNGKKYNDWIPAIKLW